VIFEVCLATQPSRPNRTRFGASAGNHAEDLLARRYRSGGDYEGFSWRETDFDPGQFHGGLLNDEPRAIGGAPDDLPLVPARTPALLS
jgi:hypothetical protein